MNMFYFMSAILVLTVLVSWVANKLPMELSDEDEDVSDWSKL
jgi:hypothetical protein